MPSPNSAVFLSYASQDAVAARRIVATLRAAKIEVWFDEAELVGGDAWDRKIKQQIRECALFLPVISAHTEARLEGYFRREWRMAVDRMADMDDALPFLFPIVIDDTNESTARVPDRFRERQWTHLPAGETSPAFVERLTTLLAGNSAPDPTPSTSPAGTARFRNGKPGGMPTWLIACMVIFGVGTGLYYAVRLPLLQQRDPAPSSSVVTPAETPPLSDERPYFIGTLAVPPTQVIVRSPESTAFAEGLQEEILTELSRMSAFEIVAQPTTAATTAGPAADFVVETSLQVDGTDRRITLRIIEAATNRHVAAETFSVSASATDSAALERKELA
ncbi:TIR domain-containing protein [Actomonas aquatica]|uniref:TIR domain-containing protein n=1 Tax=Actomonas aquatica TaxID=2866162 RepID=A0ABZ1C5T3_9BACT|nr:TIR domain-containing protein [Opitutus sp. WL0086]WRQ85884.1 TIR domain-containing protein [Opitutus sp. WL0086]